MEYKEQYYYPYKDLCETGRQTINTKDITAENINTYFYSALNILRDGIETFEVQSMQFHVIFQDKEECDLSIFDFVFNIMFWQLNTGTNEPITSDHIVFFEDMTRKNIKTYIDKIFLPKYRKEIPFMKLNNIIDDVIGKFRDLRQFQMYLCNTLNLEDTIDLMNEHPDFNDTIHFDPEGIPLADVKNVGLEKAKIQIDYIKNSGHCLRDSFRTGEAINPKQYKEVYVNLGSKPDGQGSVFPHPVRHSFVNGGLATPEELTIESSMGRVAQILQKTNVGESGAFARRLELNNQDTFLNPDPTYVCDTHNFEEVVIENEIMLKMFDLRYYRTNPNGVDKLLLADMPISKELIGKKLYFRSPMTCASAAKGHGICYKCYGDLAYVNQEVNVGQIASEGLSSIYTQILLSAKHLLESLVIKIKWPKEFYDLFQVTFNTIGLRENTSYRGYKLIIDEEIQSMEELDDVEYNYYINSFIVQTPDGQKIEIATEDADNIYFIPDFYSYLMSNKAKVIRSDDDDNFYEIDMNILEEFPALFIMEVKNNELSATMDKINKLIDNKSVIQKHDRNSILREFILTNIAGGITLNSVHFEVLLMNQIRSLDDELDLPDWTQRNAGYSIIPLSKALSNNRSIAVRLQSDKVVKAITSPQNQYLSKPSLDDLYMMVQPQEYLANEIVSDEYVPESDKEENVEEPITFNNPKVKVGRTCKVRKIETSW